MNDTKPLMNYMLRTPDGGWLLRLSVTKNGSPFQVTDLAGVMAHADQYDFHPELTLEKDSAWVGLRSAAEAYQQILSKRHGIKTEIVERA